MIKKLARAILADEIAEYERCCEELLSSPFLILQQEKKSMPKMVTLSEDRYKYLQRRDEELSALEAGGVDNWDWYHESLKNAGLLDEDED